MRLDQVILLVDFHMELQNALDLFYFLSGAVKTYRIIWEGWGWGLGGGPCAHFNVRIFCLPRTGHRLPKKYNKKNTEGQK